MAAMLAPVPERSPGAIPSECGSLPVETQIVNEGPLAIALAVFLKEQNHQPRYAPAIATALTSRGFPLSLVALVVDDF
jgi:hypothetical protein